MFRYEEVLGIKISMIGRNEDIALVESDSVLISDPRSALDLAASLQYNSNCLAMIITKSAICEDFFKLSTRIAGDVLQKFVNYGLKMAIVGDFSRYESKALRDFIYESNRGSHFFFVATVEEAEERLQRVLG